MSSIWTCDSSKWLEQNSNMGPLDIFEIPMNWSHIELNYCVINIQVPLRTCTTIQTCIWLIWLLSLPSLDIMLGQGIMQLCWYQPTHGAYLHLVTKPFTAVFRRRSETFRASHLLSALSKCAFLRYLFNWLVHSFSFYLFLFFYFIIIF